MHEEERTVEGMERRSFLKRSAVVAGATVWATPTVQSLMAPAFAAGTGLCPTGRIVRFKYDVDKGVFDSGAGSGVEWCLPTGYDDPGVVSVNSSGCYALSDGTTGCITVTVSPDGKTATVTLPPGVQVEDLQAKAGAEGTFPDDHPQHAGEAKGECDDMDGVTGTTATVTLEEKDISFVAGVICVPLPA